MTAARPSTKLKAAWTASTWAIDTAVAASGGPNAHSSDTLLGAEKVASMARTVAGFDPASRSPLLGSQPSINDRRSSAWTTPTRPSCSASRPVHTPGASPDPK